MNLHLLYASLALSDRESLSSFPFLFPIWKQSIQERIARSILKSTLVSFPTQIIDGKLWFQLDCGSGPGLLGISSRAVNDGSWHSVFLELNRNFTSLSLDDSYVERRRAPLYFQTLSTESTIYFGALVQADNIRSLTDTRVTQVLSGFQGCLDSVVLNNNELPLQNKRSSFAEVVGLTELKLGCVLYPDACERSPCQHGASCSGLPSGGECSAPWAPSGAGVGGGMGAVDL